MCFCYLCPEPPGACTNLQVITRTDTTVTVRWSRPATTGRSDFFYRIFHSDPENLGQFKLTRDHMINHSRAVTFTVTDLVPNTPYIVRVSTHNGVSDQDVDNFESRICKISAMTMEGGKIWCYILYM